MSLNQIKIFLQEVREELKKVTWPTRKQALRLTGIVIFVSLAISVYLSFLDFLMLRLVRFLTQR